MNKLPGALALALILAGSLFEATGATYSITDLGTLGGTSSKALGINATGQIVGSSTLVGNVVSHAFLYSPGTGTMRDLGTLGGISSQANGVNSAGLVVGSASLSSGSSGFVYALGLMIGTDTLGGTSGEATAINTSGKSVGNATTANNAATRAYIYDGRSLAPIATLGGTNNHACAINDAGQVAGDSQTTNNTSTRAFRYTPGGNPVDLGTLGSTGLLGSSARGINANGNVVGAAYLANGQDFHAFLYRNNAMSDLGTLGGTNSQALAINESDVVVGSSETTPNSAVTHAFIQTGGPMQDLNALIAPNSGWELTTATAINNAGQIVGQGIVSGGQTHAFLLSVIVPISPTATAPRIYINGGRRVTTDRRTLRVEGSTGGTVASVKYRIGGKGAYRSIGGTAGWHFRAKLKIGRNLVQVIAVGPDGRKTLPAKVVITRI